MSKISTLKVIEALRVGVKKSGWSYPRLAEKLGLSESGTKKLMTNTDMSLGRIQQICEICELDLNELLAQADEEKIVDVFLSREQEEFLLRHPKIFKFYWKLKVDGISRSDFHRKYDSTLAETQKWVSQLEKVGLLKVLNKGQVEFTHSGLIRWNQDSPLVKYLNSIWSQKLMGRAIERGSDGNFVNLSGLYLNAQSQQDLRKECLEIFERYSKLSLRQKNQKTATRLGFLVAFTQFDFDLD